MGDPFFDLANFAVNQELDSDGRAALLGAYFGDVPEADAPARLELMRFMSDFREAMWGVVQSAVSQLDFDFAGYAEEHFERLSRTANEAAVPGRARANDEGRPQAPLGSTNSRAALRRRLGGQLVLPEPLLLQPLELLVGAHAHRALEPVLGREDPPAAEDETDARRTRGSCSSSSSQAKSSSQGRPALYSGKMKRNVISADPAERRRGRSTCSACRGSTPAARHGRRSRQRR